MYKTILALITANEEEPRPQMKVLALVMSHYSLLTIKSLSAICAARL